MAVVLKRVNGVLGVMLLLMVSTGGAEAGQRAMTERTVALGAAWQPGDAALAADGRPGLSVVVEFDTLRQAAAGGGTLDLPLTNDLNVRMAIAWAQADDGQLMVAGPLVDGGEGEASLTVVGDTLVGRIVVGNRLFMVRRIANSAVHVASEIDLQSLPPEAPPLVPSGPLVPRDPGAAAGDTNAFVDVMVMYTAAARAAIGGTSAIVAELTGAVNNANLALANGHVTHRFRLVYSAETAYAETGSSSTSLSRLTNSADGFMDEVLPLRNQYRADVVTLLTTDTDACGVGYLMGPSSITAAFESNAYNVVIWSCANANLSMAHEIGHNMGLHHDRPNAGTSQPAFSYAYGYAVPGLARDVMAYDCSPSCVRKQIYSTPLYSFPGTATTAGTATEDNARALDGTSTVVANFRQSLCTYTLTPTSATVAPAGGPGSLTVTAPAGCTWNATSSTPTVVTVTGGSSGNGNGTVNYLVAANTGTTARAGTMNIGGQAFTITQSGRTLSGDFDGDGKTDIGVFRPSDGNWYVRYASTGAGLSYTWGGAGDVPVAGDYDGDGKADIAVFRPSNGTWYLRYTATGALVSFVWGGAGDVPVHGDYDGDGKTDMAIFRPSTGTWYVRYTATGAGISLVWGGAGDVPVAGDYDGDGKTDIAIFRPSTGTWYVRYTATGTGITLVWGGTGDIPVNADYDGDGKADIATFRASTGTWYVRYTATGTGITLVWGGGTDVPAPGDYDGDGLADIAIFRPSTGTWYIRYSSTGSGPSFVWGGSGDIPVLGRP